MLSQLFSFLAQFWRALIPWVVVDTGQVALLRRWGVPRKRLAPGLHWKMPLRSTVDVEDGREWTYVLDPQSLRAADGVQLVIRLSVIVRVTDPEKYFTRCGDGKNNIQDAACGVLARVVKASAADDVEAGAILPQVLKAAKAKAKRWGMAVDSVEYHDCVRTRSLRLWQSSFTSTGQD
jgi:regulator of protease activity HflC (stomatin/prohibitin superfamily)